MFSTTRGHLLTSMDKGYGNNRIRTGHYNRFLEVWDRLSQGYDIGYRLVLENLAYNMATSH